MKHLVAFMLLSSVSVTCLAHECEKSEPVGLFDQGRRNQSLENTLYELFACIPDQELGALQQNDLTACNWFVGKALLEVWDYRGFMIKDRFMTTDELARKSAGFLISKGWVEIGTAGEQSNLMQAEALASQGHAVVALKPGHIALVLPGGLALSPGWGVKVPMAAQLRIRNVESAFVGCRLSWSFSASDKDATSLFYLSTVKHRL